MKEEPKLTIDVYNSITYVDKKEWDSLNKDEDDIFVSWDFCKVIEDSFKDVPLFFIVVRKDRRAVGKAVFSILKIQISQFISNRYKRLAEQLFKLTGLSGHHRMLYCGIPVSVCQSSLRFHDPAALGIIIHKLNQISDKERIKLIALGQFCESEVKAIKNYMPKDFVLLPSLPDHKLVRHFEDYDQYLSSLSKNQRSNMRKSLRKVSGMDIKIVKEYYQSFTKEDYGLYLNVNNKAEIKLETLPFEFFINFNKAFKNSFIIQIKNRQKTIGYGLTLKTKAVVHSMFVGLDYEESRSHNLLMNIFIAQINSLIEEKGNHLIFGQTSSYVKQKMGCEKIPSFVFVKQKKFRLLSKPLFMLAPILFRPSNK